MSDEEQKNTIDSKKIDEDENMELYERIKSKITEREKTLNKEIGEINKIIPQDINIEDEIKNHINKLHEYNHYKDISQGLIGRIAEKRGVTNKSLYKEFDLDIND